MYVKKGRVRDIHLSIKVHDERDDDGILFGWVD